jgi:hypothetical protein
LGRSPGGGGTAGECCRCHGCDSEEAPGLGCSSPGNGLGKGKAVHFWSHFLRRNKACETLARKKSCPFDFVVGFSTGRPWNSAIYDRLWPFSGRNPPNKRQRSVQRTHCSRLFLFGRIWRIRPRVCHSTKQEPSIRGNHGLLDAGVGGDQRARADAGHSDKEAPSAAGSAAGSAAARCGGAR